MEPTMNTYRRPILTFVSLIALLWQYGFSQSAEQCFDLEELYPDSTVMVGKASGTEAGEIIYEQETFSLSLDSFLYLDGSKGYENVWLTKDFFGPILTRQVLIFPSNINLVFNFTSAEEKLSNLCFDFFDGGGQVNISINGSPILSLEDLADLNQFDENPFSDDLLVSVEEIPNANFPSGRLCISGDIRSLIIGGQEMGIKNICYVVEKQEEGLCPIENIKAIITGCSNAGYELLVDLQLENEEATDSFQVVIEGQDYGFFAYNQLPLHFEDVQILTDALTFEVAACHQKAPDCCKRTIVKKTNCPIEAPDCIGFEEVELGIYGKSTGFSPDDLAFSTGEVDFYLIGIPTLIWMPLFGDLAVVESDFPSSSFGNGTFLFYQGISTAIDFSKYPVQVQNVSIDVRLLEGQLNVSANGLQSLLLLSLTPEKYSIGPDVTLTIKENEDDPTVSTLIFEGNIKSLLLGGTSMYADNLCINDQEPCNIGDVVVKPTSCNNEGEFYVELDFQYEGSADSFYVYQNGDSIGRFNYNSLPITLGPFTNNDPNDPNYWVIENAGEEACVATARLEEALECPNQCTLAGVEILEVKCKSTQLAVMTFDLKRHDNYEGSFTVTMEDGQQHQFKYSQLPVSLEFELPLEPISQTYEYTITICDDLIDGCCIEKTFELPCNNPPCNISDLKVENTPCDENGNFYVFLNFAYQGSGDYFVLSQNGNEIEKVAYDELPIKLGPFSAYTDEEIYWEVYDVNNPDCGGKVRLGAIDCEAECAVKEVKVFDVECIEDQTYVRLSVNFDHPYPDEQKFTLKGNDYQETFQYGDLPIRIKLPIFDADYEQGYGKLIICDEKRADCCVEAAYRIPCLKDCVIEKIEILEIECLEVSPNMVEMYKITFDLKHDGGSGSFKVATSNGEEFDFNYEELPVSLTLPKSDATTPYRLKVCDSQYDDCCADIQYEVACLPPGECRIGELITEAYPCNDDGSFFVDLNFRYQNVSDSFYLILPDTTYKLAYADLPAKIGPFKGNSDERIPIGVKDESEECGQRGFIIPADCGFNCSFQGLQAWTTDCDEDGQYYVKVRFQAFGSTGSPGYIAFVHDKAFGPFTYDENELKLGPFDAKDGMENDLLLIDLLDPINCNAFVKLGKVDCQIECGLREVAAKPIDCTSQGTLVYVLDIGYDGPENQLIEVSTETESLGVVEAGSFPVEFEISIPENGQHPIFYFCVVDQADCCARVEADLPDCVGLNCDLTDLQAEVVDCSPNGQFFIRVMPEFEGYTPGTPTSQEFKVFLEDELVGTFPKADFPLVVGPFEKRPGNGVYVVRMVLSADQTNPQSCRKTTQVRLSDCFGDECTIGDIQLSHLSCNPDGSFTLSLNFEYKNTDSDSFSLSDKSGLLGIYALADLPLDFKAVPNTDGIFAFEICLGSSADCCKGVEMEIPDCPPPPCPIEDIRMVVYDCNEDGDLFLRISPVLNEDALSEDDLFAVYIYDRFFGVFPAEKFPVEVGPVERDAGDLSISIEQRGGGDCYMRKLFEPPYCEDTCDITSFSTTALHCNEDGSYTFQIDLEVKDADNEFFDLYGPQGFIGYFKLKELPLLVDVFIPDNAESYAFEACINDNQECCARATFELPACQEACPISELETDVEDCLGEDNKSLSFKLNFESKEDEALLKDSFYVYGLDSLFGPFALEDLPISVGPIPLDPDTIDQSGIIFEIRGLTDACSYAFRVSVPDCPDIKVWPGDANADRIANHRDLIYLGVAFGQQGPSREGLTSNWEGIPSTPWAQRFEDDINFKHADCNGDGVIDIRDKAVIAKNYGQTHGNVMDAGPLPNTDYAPPVFVDLPEEGDLLPGSSFTIPIVLGTVDNPVKDIYGFAFSIAFDPNFIDPEKVQVHYPVSWFGQEEVNVLTLDKVYREDGRIEIAMTRNDQNDVSGYGPVAYLKGIILDIAGIVDTRMETVQPFGLSINDGKIPLGTQTTEIKLETFDDPYTILESFNMFPIPAGDVINFSNALDVPVDEVRIFDLQGRQVLQTYKEVNEINVADLAAGMYLIRLKIQGIVINEKFLKR